MRKVVVSKIAIKNTFQITEYLEAKFSLKTKNKFIEKLEKSFKMIQSRPESFPKSEKNPNHF